MTPTSLSTRDAGWIIFILALGAGFSVASIYYAQPLLPLMGANLHLTVEGMGLVPTLTQAGLCARHSVPAPARRPPRSPPADPGEKRAAGAPAAPVQPHRPAQLTAGGQSADRYGGDHGAGYRPGGGDPRPGGQAGKNGGHGDDRAAAGGSCSPGRSAAWWAPYSAGG